MPTVNRLVLSLPQLYFLILHCGIPWWLSNNGVHLESKEYSTLLNVFSEKKGEIYAPQRAGHNAPKTDVLQNYVG